MRRRMLRAPGSALACKASRTAAASGLNLTSAARTDMHPPRRDRTPGGYRLRPSRMILRSWGDASGTQMMPLFPSATLPIRSRKVKAALRLWRFIECPHLAMVDKSQFRLTGPSADCRAFVTYSMVSSLGFAPGLAIMALGVGTGGIWMHVVHVILYPPSGR